MLLLSSVVTSFHNSSARQWIKTTLLTCICLLFFCWVPILICDVVQRLFMPLMNNANRWFSLCENSTTLSPNTNKIQFFLKEIFIMMSRNGSLWDGNVGVTNLVELLAQFTFLLMCRHLYLSPFSGTFCYTPVYGNYE